MKASFISASSLQLLVVIALAGCAGEANEPDEAVVEVSAAYSVTGMQSEQVDGVWVSHRPSKDALGALFKGILTASADGCLMAGDKPVVFNSVRLDEARVYAREIAEGKLPEVELGGGSVPIDGPTIAPEDLTPEFIDHCMPAAAIFLN